MKSILYVAAQVFELLRTEDVLFLTDDDQQGQVLAAVLSAMRPDSPAIFIPSSDALPGDVAPASPANVGARVSALHRLRTAQQTADREPLACIMSGEAAARLYPPPSAFDIAPPRVAIGDTLSMEQLATTLSEIGYYADDRVDEPGEMAVRGNVTDIFPADAGNPVRIEIADGAVVSIRLYDPVSQRSVGELDALEIGRTAEPGYGLRRDGAASILAHLAPGAVVLGEKADKRRRRFLKLAGDAARGRSDAIDAVTEAEWAEAVSAFRRVELEPRCDEMPRFAEKRSPLVALARFVKPLLTMRSLVLAGSQRDLRFLRTRVALRLGIELRPLSDWAEARSLEPGAGGILEMPADSGFVDGQAVVVAASDLLGSRAMNELAPASGLSAFTLGGAEIRIGDVIVHEGHGVGVIGGLEPAPDDSGAEMIAVEYADGARRLVAIAEANRLWRYGADAGAVTLDKLDGSSWTKRRAAVAAALAESARGLAAMAEARAALTAPVLEPESAAYEAFASGFPFNETADQARAIAAVRADLSSGRPMDRLVVGDVGYGKTEVALRAAALAALAGHQVIVAAPTTVLVRQHLAGFTHRFEGTGIVVAGLSRLSSAAEKNAVKAGLADGSIDIVVGTAAVMAKGVDYARLGLTIIDEEQRFGAADKARLRGSGEVHLLSLSATPIPRTLQMALVGLQQISIIATPPARRQPIRTSLDCYDDLRIRTALLREKGRGGQSFVVVPRIEDMPKMVERLRRAAPDLAIVEAHGKMPPAEIDAAMVGFADGDGDVLVATNIIEAGLDVPRANTMIVWRADRFGLAQLHQLRGRVGRGTRRGQVILLTSEEDAIADRTLKRLRTLATYDRLGAGFEISAADLDMRGGGDLLGETQTGHMKLIGIDLYQHLLGLALAEVRGEAVDDWMPDLRIGAPGFLPEGWIPDADIRLALYVRLGKLRKEDDLDAFEEELVDRFGSLPDPAATLLAFARLRLAARAARIDRVDAGPAAIALTPRPDFAGNPTVHDLIAKNGRLLRVGPVSEQDRLAVTQDLLEAIAA